MAPERQVFCSACFELAPESRVHLIPFFNDDVRKYVDTYRCEKCVESALDQTRSRLEATDDLAEIASAATFFEVHSVFILEHRRGDPILVVRKCLLALLDQLQSGHLRLGIGVTRPL